MFRIVYWIARVLLFIMYRYHFTGRDNIPAGGCVICGNHTARIDPVFIILALDSRGEYAVMGKKELFQSRLGAALLRFVRVFPVDRSKSDVVAVKTALKALKDGKKLIVFPEGTRVSEREAADIKNGAAMFAVRAGVPLLPVYIPPGWKAWKRNDIVFGQPWTPQLEGRATSADYERISQEIMTRINALSGATIDRKRLKS